MWNFDLDPATVQGLGGIGVREVLRDLADVLEPRPKMDPVAWGREHRRITSKEAGTARQWDPERTPWVKEILWELSDESPTQIVATPKGAQLGFTELGLVWMGWSFDQDPGTFMIVWPTDAAIKRNVKQKIDPFFKSAQPLADLFGEKKDRDSSQTLFQRSSGVGDLILTSAKSAAGLRSTPVVRAMGDEIDEAPEDLAQQGDVVSLVLKRMADAGLRKKLFLPCTPTLLGKSIVWSWFQLSDQRYFMVPCPSCGTFQHLVWEQVRFDPQRPHKVVYECAHCGHGIEEKEKRQMLPEGRFEATTARADSRVAGFHVNSLYAPLGSVSWLELVQDYVNAGGQEAKLKAFWNTTLGLPWSQKSDAPEASSLASNQEPLPRYGLPARCGVITAGADVQKDRVEIRVWGWGEGLESWLLDLVVIPRRVARQTAADGSVLSWDERDLADVAADIRREVTDRWYRRPDGAALRVHLACMDVNFDTSWAWRLIWALGPRWMAIRGSGGAEEDAGGQRMATLIKVSTVERDGITNLKLVRVSSPMAFAEFYRFLAQARPEPDSKGGWTGSWHGYVHLPDWIDDAELAQLTADREIYDAKKKRRVWTKAGRNEGGDCRKYARAALEVAGFARWSSREWGERMDALDRYANQLRTARKPVPAAVAEHEPDNILAGW